MSRNESELVTEGLWLGEGRASAFGWLSRRREALDRSGVLMLPPIGYAWWSEYATHRALAERLVATGHTTLRVHYHGTGDAPGSDWEDRQMPAWRESVVHGARALHELGCNELTIVGVGLGGTLALELAEQLGAERIVAWAPVISGRQEARALGLRSLRGPDGEHVSQAGTVFGADALSDLSEIDLLVSTSFPGRILVIDGTAAEPLAERFATRGVQARRVEVDDGEQALTGAAEDAVVARGVVETVAEWIGPGRAGEAPAPRPRPDTVLAWGGGRVRETVRTLGRARLRGVESGPVDREPEGTVVLLNAGSEPHVGPGRAWVELARNLALDGLRTLRVDFRGWGESPGQGGSAPGRPYDGHGIDDTLDIIAALESLTDGPVVLVGLCAGAWTALRAVLQRPVAGVVALNPQLYWKPGDPVEALLSDTRRRRAPERAEEAAGRRTGRWDELDRAGERNWAGAWLDELAAVESEIFMLFAEGDDGLEYLHNRLDRRLYETTESGRIHVREIPEIDHAMHRNWQRPQMFEAIHEAVDASFSRAAVRL